MLYTEKRKMKLNESEKCSRNTSNKALIMNCSGRTR